MPSFEATISYGGLVAGPEEITYIRQVARRFCGLSRSELTATLCEHLGWLTPAGQPRLEAGAEVLFRLEAAGQVELPSVRKQYARPGQRTRTPLCHRADTDPGEPLHCRLAALSPVQLRWAATSREESWCNAYLSRYHPLGYHRPFGYRGRYLIVAGEHRLGCILLGGPARAPGARDRWIGRDDAQRRRNLCRVVNNSRFLIFPWVAVPHLASHVLARLARQLPEDREARWGFRPWLLESFVDASRYRGSCYRGAGWTCSGQTCGRGLARPGQVYRSTPELIFTKPLHAAFRRWLCSEPGQGASHE